MSTFYLFKDIPNLRALCLNASENISEKDDSFLRDYKACRELNRILYGAITNHNERYIALDKIYSDKSYGDDLPSVIKKRDINLFNKTYNDLLVESMKKINHK